MRINRVEIIREIRVKAIRVTETLVKEEKMDRNKYQGSKKANVEVRKKVRR